MVKDLRPALRPLGVIYGLISSARNVAYDRGFFAQIKVPKPVISVGNLTVGGTGKTPVAMALVEELKSRGLRPAVVSRGYGGSVRGIEQVEVRDELATSIYGDEPVLIASRFPEMPVIVGPDRVLAAERAAEKADVIVADDAFQHRRLARDLDIVVIDATQSLAALRPLPWGLARESWQGLLRAQLVILTKVNLAERETLEMWRARLRDLPHLKWLEAEYEPDGLVDLNGRPWSSAATSFLAVSGIGRPETFLKMLTADLGLSVTHHIWFSDHYAFKLGDLDDLQQKINSQMAVVITEKDAVKWRGLKHALLSRVAVARVRLKIVTGKESLDRALAAFSR